MTELCLCGECFSGDIPYISPVEKIIPSNRDSNLGPWMDDREPKLLFRHVAVPMRLYDRLKGIVRNYQPTATLFVNSHFILDSSTNVISCQTHFDAHEETTL